MRKRKNISALLRQENVFTPSFLRWIESQPNSVLLETTKTDRENFRSYVFHRPISIIQASSLEQIEPLLSEIETAIRNGYWVAGYIAYEAGYAFENVLKIPLNLKQPLMWFGVYEEPWSFNRKIRQWETGKRESTAIIKNLKEQPVSKIPWKDTAASLYCRLREAQHVGYSAFVNCGNTKILSFSPELFFRLNNAKLTLKPMKGTAPRGRTLDEDRQRRKELQTSAKNHAENLMIVDLLRNDAGKIATTGSVTVPSFFDIEQYQTIFQATSTIQAKLRPGVTASELIKSLFPCGSVTGAPKIRTMQIIRELEREPRGVYTGSIGFFSPKRKAQFNVAIRTIVLDKKQQIGEMGIGSGIVADSDIANEYEECLLKAKFLTERSNDFQLFETIRWEPKKRWSLLPLHLRRLRNSAQYFGFVYDPRAVQSHLGSLERKLQKVSASDAAYRVRLTLSREGDIESVHARLQPLSTTVRVGISDNRTDSRDRLYFHKTTHRELYDEELRRAQSLGLFDVLFFNERDELTEGARSNVFVKKGDIYFTPPIECGVLPGTYRSHLMKSKKLNIEEKVLYAQDLQSADEVFVCNALRGLIKVEIQKMSQ
ncbi:MAG: chorismate-binding protein [Ignavibacteriales bacterium]|nr:chorismate-binding protein [Ignavibacteriales bacterium]